jgi:WD40 repeat protein
MRSQTLSFLLLGGLVIFLPPTAARPEPDAAAIDKLIDQLGSDDADQRRDAAKRIQAIGDAALEALRKAAKSHTDVDVRLRAGLLVSEIVAKSWGEIRHFGSGQGYWLNRAAFTPDGKRAVVTGGAVIVYDVESGKELHRSLELSFARHGLALSRDGKHFLTGHQADKFVRLGEVESGKVIRTFEGHTGGVHAVAFSPDETKAASGGDDGTIRIWEVQSGKELLQWSGLPGAVRSLTFDADGRRILSGHFGAKSDFVIHLWDAKTGKELQSFKGHTKDVNRVVFLPEGKTILSSSMDGTLRIWDVDSGKELRRMEHKGGAYDVAVTPSGRLALSAGFGDRVVRVWDLKEGKEVHQFTGHPGAVLGVTVAPNGRSALSIDSQCTLYLWRLPG